MTDIPSTPVPKFITLKIDKLRQLFDIICCSLDFGSGFLETDDVELLRELAVHLGVDPNEATPSNHKRNYPHPANKYLASDTCWDCYAKNDAEIHTNPFHDPNRNSDV